MGSGIRALSHVTGGGIAANLARVLPQQAWSTSTARRGAPRRCSESSPTSADSSSPRTEGTWNLGIGFLAVVAPEVADAATAALQADGIATWQVGVVRDGARPEGDYEQGAKGVDGGAVRLVGSYADAGHPANGAV